MNNDRNMRCGVAAQAGSLADRSLSMMARIAVTALLTLAGVAMFPAGEAWAQAACADNTDAACSATITTTTADLVANGGSSTFDINITGYQFGAGQRGGAGEFLYASVNIGNSLEFGSIGVPPNINEGVTCTLASQAGCRREFESTNFTISLPSGSAAFFASGASGIAFNQFRLIMPKSLFANGGGTDTDLGDESFTITVTAGNSTTPTVPSGRRGAREFYMTAALAAETLFGGGIGSLISDSFIVLAASPDTATFTITAPGATGPVPTFEGMNIADQTWTIDSPITAITLPTAIGGGSPLTYSLMPDLPTGISASADTSPLVLSGTPTAETDETEFTYTVTDVDGDADTLMFTITVISNPTSVTVTSAENSVVEGRNALAITVALDVPVRMGTVTLPYVFSGAGITTDDFSYTVADAAATGLTGTLVFEATEQSKDIAVTAIADSTTETDGETLKFKLTANDGTGQGYNGVVVGDDDEVDITINDTPPTEVSVDPIADAIAEEDGTIDLTVALDNPLRASDIQSGSTTVDIAYTLNTGTATVTDDYTVQCGDDAASLGTCTSPFAFAAGDQSKIVRVTAVSDFADDDDETVILALADADIMLPDSNTLDVPNDAGAVITITDDDVPPTAVSSITPNPSSIREDGGTSTITVTLDSAAVTGGVSIPYAFSGTAVRGTDFTAPASPLVIPAGNSTGTITVTVPSTAADDDEDNETIIFTLSATTPVLTLPSPASATITITDLVTLRWRDVDSEVPLGTTNPLDLSSPTADFARRSDPDGEGPFYLELPDNVAAGDVIEVQYEVRSADGSTSELTLFITVPASSTP